jgi:undecaprenyl-diphosphatase
VSASLLTLPPLLVYLALFALIAGESAGLPLPGETSLIAVGALAAHGGRLAIVVVIAVAAAAAIVGDNVGFVLGRRGGRWLLTREGRWASARSRYLEKGELFFERHGPKAVFLARWLPGLRVVGAWLAGTHGMRWSTFLVWNALGGIAWAISIGTAAYLLGQAASGLISTFGIAGVALVVTVVAGVVSWHLVRRHRRPFDDDDPDAAAPAASPRAGEALDPPA